VPVGRRILAAHDVRTVYQMAGQGCRTEICSIGPQTQELKFSGDQNIAFQQKLASRPIAVVVLATNRWSVIQAQPIGIGNAVANANPGVCSVVTFGRSRRRRLMKT
jgi:hypothetical protein